MNTLATLERPGLEVPRDHRIARLALDMASSADTAPEGIMRSIRSGESVYLPGNFIGGEEFVLPSLSVETFRGNEALIVPFYTTDGRLNSLYTRASRGKQERITRMTYEMAVRMLDTSGADGLHHMHDTRLPRTIFYNAKHSGPQVYMTSVGEVRGDGSKPRQILAVVAATAEPRDELALLRVVGGNRVKGRRSA